MTEAQQEITEDEAPMRLSSPPASSTRKRPYKARRTSAQVKYDNAVKQAAKERASEATQAKAEDTSKALSKAELERVVAGPVIKESETKEVKIVNRPEDQTLSKIVTTTLTTVVYYGQTDK